MAHQKRMRSSQNTPFSQTTFLYSSRRGLVRLTYLGITHRSREDSSKADKVNFCSQPVGIFHCSVTSLKSFYMYKPIRICKYICIYWHQGEPSLVVIYQWYVLMFVYSWGYVNSFEKVPKAFFFLFYLGELRGLWPAHCGRKDSGTDGSSVNQWVSLALCFCFSLWGPLTQNICRSVLPSFTSLYFGSRCHHSSASNTSTRCINLGWFLCSVAGKVLFFHIYKPS